MKIGTLVKLNRSKSLFSISADAGSEGRITHEFKTKGKYMVRFKMGSICCYSEELEVIKPKLEAK